MKQKVFFWLCSSEPLRQQARPLTPAVLSPDVAPALGARAAGAGADVTAPTVWSAHWPPLHHIPSFAPFVHDPTIHVEGVSFVSIIKRLPRVLQGTGAIFCPYGFSGI